MFEVPFLCSHIQLASWGGAAEAWRTLARSTWGSMGRAQRAQFRCVLVQRRGDTSTTLPFLVAHWPGAVHSEYLPTPPATLSGGVAGQSGY